MVFNAMTKPDLNAAIIRDPIVVSPETRVMAAIWMMSELRSQCETQQDRYYQQGKMHIDVRSSCVLAIENERVVGILTERDVVRLSAEQRSLDQLTVREVMTHPVLTLRESAFTDFFMTVNLILQQRIRHLPIVDNRERLVGIVTHESLRQASRPIDLLRLRLVSEVMTTGVICAQPEQPMLAIARLMATHHVSSVIILGSDRTQPNLSRIPIGIITERDIVQFQSLGLNFDQCTASEMMSSPIFTVKSTDSLLVVYQLMEQHFISRLAVVDADRQLLGIITQSNMLQALNPLELYNLAAMLEQKILRLEAEKVALLESRNLELEQQQVQTYQQLQSELKERQKTEIELIELTQSLEAKVSERTQELQASNAKIRAMIHALPDLLLRVNRHGECLEYINTGEYRDKFVPVQHHISEVLPPDLCQRQLDVIERALITGHLQVYEHELYDQHNHLVSEEVRIVPIGNDEALIIVRNQTEQKQIELALKASEARFRGIFDANVVGMLFLNLQGEIIDANDCFLNLVGYSRDDLHSGQLDWAKIIAPEYLAVDMHMIAHAPLNGAVESEKIYHHKDGHPVYVLSSLAMVSAEECVCIVVDIGDLKHTEKELQQKLVAIENAIDGIAIVEDGKYIYLNRAHVEMFGYADVNELLGGSWQVLYSSTELERFENEIFPKLLKDRAWAGDSIATRKDGSTFDQSLSLNFTEDNLLICICRNISDRKQTEQIIAQQAQQEILLREITQRIRTSLNLQTIFDTACQEIRQLLNADRVGIFKFNMNSGYDDGEFVAEAAVAGLRSVLAQPVYDHCFGEDYSPLYVEGHFSAMDDIYNHGLQPCHIQVLAQFQIRANLIIPLFYGENLWGLLCVHQCDRPRKWQRFEINLTQQIAIQLAIAIQQASLYNQVQSELLERQQAEANIATQLRRQQAMATITQQILLRSLDLEHILITVIQQVKEVLDGDRVIIFRLFPDSTSHIVQEAVSDGLPQLKNLYWENEVWSQEILDLYWRGQPRIVPDVMDDPWTKCLVEYSTEGQIQSKIVAPILQEIQPNESHRWVSPHASNKLWGILVIHACTEKRVWMETEAQLLQQIANQLAIAIQQIALFDQLQQELSDRQQAQKQLTERNEQLAMSNAELARATRLKDEFLANMSHELRTPLNAILGMTEGLQEQIFGNVTPSQVRALQTIERSGTHLLELINDILDVAKIESGQVELEYSNVNIESLCQSSITFIKQLAIKKRIQIYTQFPRNLPELNVDERRIRQVLINLLSNAVKFTPEDGTITLDATVLPLDITANPENTDIHGYVRISISDTGIGIAEENISKLFQPFFQIDSALNRQYQGTGLGLPLVKRIVEMHGGKVVIKSQLGSGSCFMIDIPYVSDRSNLWQSPQTNATNSVSPISGEVSSIRTTILLVEDNEANIITISSYLVAKGYEIVLAHNGQEALTILESLQPDLILMDIQMPVMDGLEATQRIRQIPALANIPIIALTALAMSKDTSLCIDAGANTYLSKPVKLRELTTTIQRLINVSSGS